MMGEIHKIYSVTDSGCGALLIDADFTGATTGERMREVYALREGDEFGSAPMFQQWLEDNKPTILPYIAPTVVEARERMQPLARVDFRLKLKQAGINTSVINAAIASVHDEGIREEYEIIWEDGQAFGRLDPFVLTIFEFAGMTPDEADSVWTGS
ncbi:hypothetical protein [Brucella sp. 10RB9213]|uniref:hypothetical protein n=1 Tax=Brucella sp. 10RB9213 TaxID=1844039 RepID=UPI0012AD7E31|nr:hypothetical protein [Brucella sp. 10RB9213]MRN66410.1 hypothetical protein [Brucella sp. 10RB9213]